MIKTKAYVHCPYFRYQSLPLIGLCVCFLIVLLIRQGAHASLTPAGDIQVGFQNRQMDIRSDKARLGDLLVEIRVQSGIDITGLDDRETELVTFSGRGKPEKVLEQMLEQISEQNFALEYTDQLLSRIMVLPSKSGGSKGRPGIVPGHVPNSKQPPESRVSVVVVQLVEKNTQGEQIGLQSGDIVLEYGGVRIHSSQQLIREVKNKENENQVDMTVIRNRQNMMFSLTGGFIGIRIREEKLPKSIYEQY